MSEEQKITAKDKLILTIVLIIIFVGVFGLGLIGVIYSLSSWIKISLGRRATGCSTLKFNAFW